MERTVIKGKQARIMDDLLCHTKAIRCTREVLSLGRALTLAPPGRPTLASNLGPGTRWMEVPILLLPSHWIGCWVSLPPCSGCSPSCLS